MSLIMFSNKLTIDGQTMALIYCCGLISKSPAHISRLDPHLSSWISPRLTDQWAHSYSAIVRHLSDQYITHKLQEVADNDANKTKEVLIGNRQALWTALRLSISQRFGYCMQHTPPSLSEPVGFRVSVHDILGSNILKPHFGVEKGKEFLDIYIPAIFILFNIPPR